MCHRSWIFLKNRTSWDVEDWKALASDTFLRCPKEFGGEGNWVLHYLCVRNSVMGVVWVQKVFRVDVFCQILVNALWWAILYMSCISLLAPLPQCSSSRYVSYQRKLGNHKRWSGFQWSSPELNVVLALRWCICLEQVFVPAWSKLVACRLLHFSNIFILTDRAKGIPQLAGPSHGYIEFSI